MEQLVVVNSTDNVAVATVALSAGTDVDLAGHSLHVTTDIPVGNKVAIKAIEKGQAVVKLGQPIGHASQKIESGQLVNAANLSAEVKEDEWRTQPAKATDLKDLISQKTFMGYRRKSGKVGIRNDLYIVPTVGCITPLMDVMVQQFKAEHPDNGSFDNIVLLKHPYGCSQLGEDFAQTRQILCDAALQPNAGGVLVFGLGCENNQMAGMKETIDKMAGIDPERMKFLVAQDVKDEFSTAQQMLEELNAAAAHDHREEIPLSELKVGLQTVQSNNLATATSNRLLAALADFVNVNGGTTVISGLPELTAGKQVLLNQAKDDEAKSQVNGVFDHLADYYNHFDDQMVKAPSQAEQSTGVTTAVERFANDYQIAGHSQISAALPYDHKVKSAGLNLLEAPNNELIVSSGEAAADCQMVVASEGVASPYASFVPSVKVAADSKLAQKKARWFDFDGGQVLDRSFDDVAKEFIETIIDIASGKETKNEQMGLHGLAIFKIGVTE